MPTVCELKSKAKAAGIRGFSKMRKAELEAALNSKKIPELKSVQPKMQLMEEMIPASKSGVTSALTPVNTGGSTKKGPNISEIMGGNKSWRKEAESELIANWDYHNYTSGAGYPYTNGDGSRNRLYETLHRLASDHGVNMIERRIRNSVKPTPKQYLDKYNYELRLRRLATGIIRWIEKYAKDVNGFMAGKDKVIPDAMWNSFFN